MIAESVKTKFSNIFHFLLSSFSVMFISAILSLITFIGIAIAGNILSGDWTIGTSFSEWWGSMTKSPIIDGKFSATDFNTCWSCSIFARLFDLMGTMSVNLYVYIADIAWVLMWGGLAVWILNYMYKNIILEQSGDVAKMLWEIGAKVIIIGIVSAGLFYTSNKSTNNQYLKSMANTVFENTAVPVLKMGVGLSAEILQTNMCDKLYYPEHTESDNILSRELKDDMLCLMNTVNTVFLSAMNAGSNMVSMAWKTFIANPAKNVKNLPDIIAGMAVIVIFFLMYTSIPFTLIDIVFTVGLLIAFIPLFIGCYAYQDIGKVKGFAQKGIKSIWGMAFYIIMYSIFLGILYSSFVYIADMYYPGPLDNFTYLFPDFVYSSMVNGESSNILLNEAFNACYTSAGGNISKIQSCLASSNIQLNFPSLDNPGGSFLPMFTFGILSLMIMYGSLKSYTGLIGNNMLEVGSYAKSILQSFFSLLTSVTRTASNFVKAKTIENIEERELEKQTERLIQQAKIHDEQSAIASEEETNQ